MISSSCKAYVEEFELGRYSEVPQFVEGWNAGPSPLLFIDSVEDHPPFCTDRGIFEKVVEEDVAEFKTLALIKSPESRSEVDLSMHMYCLHDNTDISDALTKCFTSSVVSHKDTWIKGSASRTWSWYKLTLLGAKFNAVGPKEGQLL